MLDMLQRVHLFLHNREQRRALLDQATQLVLLAVLNLLSWISVVPLQDWLLSTESFRSLVLRAFRPRFEAVIAAALVQPGANPHSFDSLEYYVDASAKQLLQFAGLHALSVQLTAAEALPPTQLLPCVSRVLLQTEEKNSGRYLEAVAAALASSMHAALLPLDSALLSQLADAAFSGGGGGGGGFEGDGGSTAAATGAGILSGAGSLGGLVGGGALSGVDGGVKLRLAWEALKQVVNSRRYPTVVFLRSTERLLCGSFGSYEAFSDVWGNPEILALEGGSAAPLVLVAGCSLAERGAGVTEGRGKSGGGDSGSGSNGGSEEEHDDGLAPKSSKGGFFKGLFGGDDMGLFDSDSGLGALLKELEGPALEDKPNPRRVLPRLFPTRVKLQPPPSGPAALRHQQRMARDALEAAEEDNYRAARSTAVSAGVKLPPKSCGVYSCSTPLSKGDWAKALAWAVTYQLMQQQGQQKGRQQQQGQGQGRAASVQLLGGPLSSRSSEPAGALPAAQPAAQQQEEEEEEEEHGEGEEQQQQHPDVSSSTNEVAGGAAEEEGEQQGAEGVGARGKGANGKLDLAPALSDSSKEGTGAQADTGGEAGRSSHADRPTQDGGSGTNGKDGSGGGGSGAFSAVELALGTLLGLVPLPLVAGLQARLQRLLPGVLQLLLAPALGLLGWVEAAAKQAQQAQQQAHAPAPAGQTAQQAQRAQPQRAQHADHAGSHVSADISALCQGLAGAAELAGSAAAEGEEEGDLVGVLGDGSSSGGSGDVELTARAVLYGLGMVRRSGGGIKQGVRAANSYESKLLAEVLSPEDCGGGFSEVGALDEAKQALREAVQLPLQHPNLFGGGALARPSKGVLLFGPPGTGKTLLARAAAAECGASFLGINPSSVASKWFGDGVRFIRACFSLAEKLTPCVIFVDEVDALLGRRNSLKEHEALREMKNEFMSCWDGIRGTQSSRVMVLGATNRPFDIDEAVLRRFTHRVFVGLPSRPARAQILSVVLAGEALAPDVDLGRLAEVTDGYSGSDLRQVCVQAAMRPVRELLEAESKAAAAAALGDQVPLTKKQQRQQQQSPGHKDVNPAAAGEDAAGAGSGSDGGVGQAAASEGSAGTAGQLALALIEEHAVGRQLQEAAAAEEEQEGTAGSELVPLPPQQLGLLLAAAEGIAGEASSIAKNELRPISMQDFEEARKEVTATVDPDSSVIQELNDWNNQYGTIGRKQSVGNKRLSYYL